MRARVIVTCQRTRAMRDAAFLLSPSIPLSAPVPSFHVLMRYKSARCPRGRSLRRKHVRKICGAMLCYAAPPSMTITTPTLFAAHYADFTFAEVCLPAAACYAHRRRHYPFAIFHYHSFMIATHSLFHINAPLFRCLLLIFFDYARRVIRRPASLLPSVAHRRHVPFTLSSALSA